jgi:hypothetical protein
MKWLISWKVDSEMKESFQWCMLCVGLRLQIGMSNAAWEERERMEIADYNPETKSVQRGPGQNKT